METPEALRLVGLGNSLVKELTVDDHSWRDLLITPALTVDGGTTQIVVGLISAHERTQLALRIGQHGIPVLFGAEAAGELISNLQRTVETANAEQGRRP